MQKIFENNVDFENVYVTHFSKLKRFAQEYVISEADAENIVQDVFLELWEKRNVLSMPVNLNAFLFTSTKNKCIDHLRHKLIVRETNNKLLEEQQLKMKMKFDSLEAFDQNLLTDNDIEEILNKAINSLPENCRQIFIKSRLEGKKQKQIAEEMNISINTVETQMGIAYKKLKIELKDYLPLLFFLVI